MLNDFSLQHRASPPLKGRAGANHKAYRVEQFNITDTIMHMHNKLSCYVLSHKCYET